MEMRGRSVTISLINDALVTSLDVSNHALRGIVGNLETLASVQHHLAHPSHRVLAMGIAVASMAAMLYIGLYQSRTVRHIWCPVFAKGCEAVADAAFARPFGIPDGYIAAGLYAVIFLLLMAPTAKLWIWVPLLVLASAATLANFLGVRDMVNFGRFCFYCTLTTVLSPVLLLEIWWLR